jgi:hypothetical protein
MVVGWGESGDDVQFVKRQANSKFTCHETGKKILLFILCQIHPIFFGFVPINRGSTPFVLWVT